MILGNRVSAPKWQESGAVCTTINGGGAFVEWIIFLADAGGEAKPELSVGDARKSGQGEHFS